MKNFNLDKLTVFNNQLFTQAKLDEYALPIKAIIDGKRLPLAFTKDNPDNASMVRIDLIPKNHDVVLEKYLNFFESLKNNYPKFYMKVNNGKLSFYIPKKDEDRQILTVKQLLDSNDYYMYLKEERGLPFVIGESVENKVIIDDLTQLPHLLIAGLSGGGKSVILNFIISCFLYQLSPEELKFAMFDMKLVELSLYDKIPHLAYPICTDPEEAKQVLVHLVKEMNNRLSLMAKARTLNIKKYNQTAKVKMPYLVVVFDEFADLILSNKDVEKIITSLAQKGRACGIHLILATQRPDANIVTGQIKANIPAKIALTVTDNINSRIILDENGAELLNKKGDLLYKGSNGTIRLQAPLLEVEDRELIIEAICEKYGTNKFYEETVKENVKEEIEEVKPFEMQKIYIDGDNKDGKIVIENEIYDLCTIVINKGKASRAMVRKETSWGDGRSERAIQRMEKEFFVCGKYDEVNKCNPILVSLEDFKKRYIRESEANG